MLAGVGTPFFETHYITFTSVACAVGPSVNSLFVAWTQHIILFCKVYLDPIARSFQQHQTHITIPST
jgi:hypothetical protein